MNSQYSVEQLMKLAANPNYKLSEEQLELLDEYRRSSYVKHSTTFTKHDPSIKEENE